MQLEGLRLYGLYWMHECRRGFHVASWKFSYEVDRDACPIRHFGFGRYKTCFLLISEDLALVVRLELAVLDGKCNRIDSAIAENCDVAKSALMAAHPGNASDPTILPAR